MVTDKVADLLTRIRNAQRAGHPTVQIPASGLKDRIVKVLNEEGYVGAYRRVEDEGGKPAIEIDLKYTENGEPAIRELRRISSPGRRMYIAHDDVKKYRGGLGTYVFSTSQGVVSDSEARRLGVGGELICSVF